jgi:hypothetical protein
MEAHGCSMLPGDGWTQAVRTGEGIRHPFEHRRGRARSGHFAFGPARPILRHPCRVRRHRR